MGNGGLMRKRRRTIPVQLEDKAFFHEFYESNKNFMFYIASKYTTDPSDREDLVQDTTLRLMGQIPVLRELNAGKRAKYIALSVRSAFLDMKRRQKDNLLYLEDAALEALMVERALAEAAHVTANQAVVQLKEQLPARDWMVLEGKYLLELSQEEIAEQIGVAPDSVRMILHRAKQKARQILQQTTGGDV